MTAKTLPSGAPPTAAAAPRWYTHGLNRPAVYRAAAVLAGALPRPARLALARALAREPRALLLDEPFASLDPSARRELRANLRTSLQQWRLPALIVSHDPQDAMLADRIAVVEGGRIVQQGTPEELRRAPASPFVAAFHQRPPID